MPLAIDTILAKVTNTSGALTAATIAAGNSATIRNSPDSANTYLESVLVKGAASAKVQVKSPLMHDDVTGLEFTTAQGPATFAFPHEASQRLRSQDTLEIAATSGATDSTAVALSVYYSDLGGGKARLVQWGDISGIIEHYKTVSVLCTASATIGAWNDTKITTTQNTLKANRDYAVLGYVVDVACLAVAFSGQDTSNLRVSGPGSLLTDVTADYFVEESRDRGTPHIPVFNSAAKDTTFVSVADNAASTAVNVQLVLALLSTNLPN